MKRLSIVFCFFSALFSAAAFAACSTDYQRQVVINEYNYINNYIELKILDPGVLAATNNLNGWTLTLKINSGSGRTTSKNVGGIIVDSSQNTCSGTSATYVRIPFAANEMENDAVALLKDGAGNEVDLFMVRQAGSSYPSLATTCTSWPYDTILDPDMSSSGPKDLARYPDGTGNWAESPGTGSGSFETACSTNNDVAKLSKSVNVTSAPPGATVIYSLTLTNGTGAAAGTTVVTDLLPPGLSYVNSTPAGVYDAASGRWTISSLPDKASQTLTITTAVQAAACPGTSIANTAQLTSGLAVPGGAVLPPASVSFNLLCAAVAQGFNAVEAGALTAEANVASGRLYTKLVGTAFVFDVVALNSSGLRETNFGTKNVQVELVDASSGSCDSFASLTPVQTQTVAFADGDQGRRTVAPITVNRAYRKLAVRMSSDGISRCSSDHFSIRPASFSVSSAAANADATGVSTEATPRIAAGTPFSLQAVAVAGYDGTPQLNATSSRWQAHGASAVEVVPSGSFATAVAATGTAAGADFSYLDVGYFRLAEVGAVEDTAFTAIDQSADCTDDYSNTPVNGKYGCRIGNAAPSDYFGRFVPHHFSAVPAATLIHRADIAACDAPSTKASFTYLGEPLRLTFELQAQHAANGVTKKYEGAFARLNPAVPAQLAFAAKADTTNLTGDIDFACSACATSGAWGGGVAVVQATLALKRPTALPLPYYAAAASRAVNFGIRPDDGDIDHALAVYDVDMDAALAGNDRLLIKKDASSGVAADYLFGRMRLTSTYGSELLPLTVPVEMQVWNGVAFITAADSCTPLAPGNIALDPVVPVSVASITSIVNGRGGVRLAAPAQRAAVRVCADLGADHLGANDTSCTAATPAALRYLTGPWDGTSGFYDRDPSARANFGLNRTPYIYYRAR